MQLAPVVHQRIAGPAIKPQHAAVRAQHAEVGDAANVQHEYRLTRSPEDTLVKGGHQRRALAARCHVAAAQIGHHGDTGSFGQQGGAEQLQGVARAVEFLGAVAHGLPVGAEGADGAGRQAAALQQRLHHLGIGARQRVACKGRAVQFVVAGGVESQQLGAQGGRKGGAGVVADPHARAGEVGQHAVDAVERGARHQADVQIGCAHCSCAQCESVGLKAPLSAALCALQLARRRPAAAAQGPPRRVCGALLASAGGVPLRGEGAQRLRGGFIQRWLAR